MIFVVARVTTFSEVGKVTMCSAEVKATIFLRAARG